MRSQFARVQSGHLGDPQEDQDGNFARVSHDKGHTHIVISSYRQPNLIQPQLQLFNLKGQHLHHIYNDRVQEFMQDRDDPRTTYTNLKNNLANTNQFQLDVILSFFLSVHLLRVDIAGFLYDQEDIVRKLVLKLTFAKPPFDQRNISMSLSPQSYKKPKFKKVQRESGLRLDLEDDDEDESERGDESFKSRQKESNNKIPEKSELLSDKSGDEEMGNPNLIQMKSISKDESPHFSKIDVEEAVKAITSIEQARKQLSSKDNLRMIRELMMKKGAKIAMNVLKIALNKEEEKLACIIVAHYPVHIDSDMLSRAIRKNMYDFLQTVWGYGKNVFVDQPGAEEKTKGQKQNVERVTLSMLFDRILKLTEEAPGTKIRQVVRWKYQFEKELMIQSLLQKHQDFIAIEALNDYYSEVKKGLYLYALNNQNQEFVNYCLKTGVFAKEVLSDNEVVQTSMKLVHEGRKTLFLLKCFAFYDFNSWSKKQIRDFMNLAEALYKTPFEKNSILLSYNPLMQLSLCAQYCQKIGKKQKAFQLKCERIVSKLLELCVTIIERIDDEKLFEQYFMQTDFKQRSMFNIISMNKFNKLMLDEKISNLLTKIWDGEDVKQCDGKYKDFSLLAHLFITPARKVPGRTQGLKSIFENNFQFQSDFSQWFQFQFRRKSISFFYIKEVLFALGILFIYQYINFLYLDLFQDKNFRNQPAAEKQANLDSYKNWNVLAFIISGSLLFSFILKMVFNILAKRRLRCDIWTFLDVVCAFVNLVAVNVVSNFTVDELLDISRKQSIDYYIILVMSMSWVRFFSYLLVNRHISPLMNTLFRMVVDTFYFMVILLSYMAIMSSVFETLFIDVDGDNFGTFVLSFRSLFSAMMGDFSYDNAGSRETSFSIFMIVHLFISSILLLNYLIAILSTVYQVMRDFGDFSFKAGLYSYCERYLIPFNDPRYGQLVVHPAPICLLSIVLLPSVCWPNTLRKMSVGFSMVMFWIENVFMILLFIVAQLLIMLVVYFKMFPSIMKSADKCTLRFLTLLIWLPFGVFILLFFIVKDVINFVRLLCKMTEAEDEKQEKRHDEDKRQDTIVISNELILAMYRIFFHLSEAYKIKEDEATRKLIMKEGGQVDKAEDERNPHERLKEKMNMIDNKTVQEIEVDLEGQQGRSFFVSKNVIVEEWIKVRPDNENLQPGFMSMNRRDDLSSLFFKKPSSQSPKSPLSKLNVDKIPQDYDDLAQEFMEDEKKPVIIEETEEAKENKLSELEDPIAGDIHEEHVAFKHNNHLNELVGAVLRKQKVVKAEPDPDQNSDADSELSDDDKIDTDEIGQDVWKMLDALNIEIPKDEVEIVKNLLFRFSMTSEQSSAQQVDLRLTLMALPLQINETNFSRVELFNFKLVQESLIDFQHQEVVDLFQYYDNRHRARFTKIMARIQRQAKEMHDIRRLTLPRVPRPNRNTLIE